MAPAGNRANRGATLATHASAESTACSRANHRLVQQATAGHLEKNLLHGDGGEHVVHDLLLPLDTVLQEPVRGLQVGRKEGRQEGKEGRQEGRSECVRARLGEATGGLPK